jgi:hypothetical protein
MFLKAFLVLYAALALGAGQSPAVWRTSYGHPTSATLSGAKQPRLPLYYQQHAGVAPRVPASPHLSAGPRAALFPGLNKPGIKATDNSFSNFGSPPDTTGSIGPGYYLEIVNVMIGVFNRSDLSLKASSDLQSFVHLPASSPLCDPQVQWDQSSQRWLFVILGCSLSSHFFMFGWSKSPDPSDLANGWCSFAANTPGVITDYPKLGHSAGYMLVGSNNFSGPTTFAGAQLTWMATPLTTDRTCVKPTINRSVGALKNGDNSLTLTPVPVNTTTNATDGYVLSAYDPSGPPPNLQSHVSIWHVNATGTLIKDPDFAVNTYTSPNPAPNAGGAFPIDTLDARLTQAVGDPVLGMWTQHTVSPALGSTVRSQVDWYEIQISGGVPVLAQQGTIASPTDFVFNGAVSPTFDGSGAAIEYNRSSGSEMPLIATQARTNVTAAGQWDPGVIIVRASTDFDQDFSCNYLGSGAPCRWGDYSGAAPDPLAANLVWGANQVLENHNPSFPTDPNWVTQIFAIVVGRNVAQSGAAPPGSRPPVTTVPPATPHPR